MCLKWDKMKIHLVVLIYEYVYVMLLWQTIQVVIPYIMAIIPIVPNGVFPPYQMSRRPTRKYIHPEGGRSPITYKIVLGGGG